MSARDPARAHGRGLDGARGLRDRRCVTAAFGLGGPAAAAVAVDWTAGAPAAADWQPCVALGAGRWRLDGPGSAIAAGVLSVAVRYRLAAGPASPASGRKTLTVVEPLPRLPLLVAAPALTGSGKIGQPVTLTPGLWSDPAAALAIEWRRNGVALSGATGTAYAPQPADDMTELSVRVTATNAAGNLAVVTAALSITYVAPEAVGVLPEEVFDEGTGPQEVPAKGAFRGENLSFAANGAGASVDSEGVVSIPTDVPLSDTVTVTATNSGGSATQSFAVTVEPAEDACRPSSGPPTGRSPSWSRTRPSGHVHRRARDGGGRPGGRGGRGVLDELADLAGPAVPGGAARQPALAHALVQARARLARARARRELRQPGGALRARGGRADLGQLARPQVLDGGGDARADSVDGDWRQVVDRLQAERDAPPDQPELWGTAVYGGEGLQWFHGHGRGVSNPDRVVGGQDMGSVRASANGGRFWYAPLNDGLQIIGVEAMLVDPVDADVVYALATTYFDKDFAHDGVYRSTDFCRTWTLVHNIPRLQPFNRYAKKTIARWPVETGAAGAASIRVATMMGGYDEPDEASQLWNGAGGGTSWTSKGTLSRATYGRLAQLCQHPTTENTLYLCSETGLHVTTNWNAATPDWSRPWARFGASVAVSRIWIDPDNVNRIIVGCTGADADQGIWFSADGGATWTHALDIDAGNFAMGCRDPASANRRIYVHNKAATRPKVSTYAAAGGSPFGAWTEPSVVPSAPGVTELDYTSLSYERPRQPMGSFHEFLPHPTDPDECLNYAYHHYFRTIDGGASFRDFELGLLRREPSRPRLRPGSGELGRALRRHRRRDHARLFDVARVSASFRVPESIAVAGDTLRSGRAITVLPRVAPVPAAARGRVIVTAGNASNLGIYHKPEDGKAVGWQGFGEIDPAYGGQGVQRARLDYDRQAPNWVYCGRNRSDDGGTTWGDLAGGYDFAAVSRQDGARILRLRPRHRQDRRLGRPGRVLGAVLHDERRPRCRPPGGLARPDRRHPGLHRRADRGPARLLPAEGRQRAGEGLDGALRGDAGRGRPHSGRLRPDRARRRSLRPAPGLRPAAHPRQPLDVARALGRRLHRHRVGGRHPQPAANDPEHLPRDQPLDRGHLLRHAERPLRAGAAGWLQGGLRSPQLDLRRHAEALAQRLEEPAGAPRGAALRIPAAASRVRRSGDPFAGNVKH